MREPKRMEVLHTRMYAAHTSSNAKIVWNILVAILQDDSMLFESNSGDKAAIDGTAVISDNIWMTVLFKEFQDLSLTSYSLSTHDILGRLESCLLV